MSKKKPSMNFSLLNGFSETLSCEGLKSPKFSIKSPRIYETGVVGLGIVAAMNEIIDVQEGFLSAKPSRDAKKMAVSPKSQPIPITSTRIANKFRESDEDEEFLSESYTCVISHVGDRSIRKREYFNELEGDCFNHQRFGTTSSHGIKGEDDNYWNRKAVFSSSPLENFDVERGNSSSGFLSYCHLCRKSLHGLDIFMYRGDKGFCSVECRSQQILCDELREKSWTGSLKVADFFFSSYSVSRPLAGFAAA